MLKRGFDFIVALVGLLVCSPVLLILSVLVKLDSKGPAFFVQTRVGKDGRLFECYKLRTMKVGTPQTLSHLGVSANITRMGRFLRWSKQDELPQLYNVLRGEMSLVGPRPGLPNDVRLMTARKTLNVLSARPGITGLAQVCGVDMSQPDLLAEVDARYLYSRTLWRDLSLCALTVINIRDARSHLLGNWPAYREPLNNRPDRGKLGI